LPRHPPELFVSSLSPAYLKTNLLSGLTVALALVPEAIAFALVAHLSPLTGLYAAVLVAFITSAFGGRPGMISAAAGSLAVVMIALVVQHGAQYCWRPWCSWACCSCCLPPRGSVNSSAWCRIR
jgi:MFS superfamily sulfate permease-like transporter